VFPHAQTTVVVAYTGWISAFTGNLWACVLGELRSIPHWGPGIQAGIPMAFDAPCGKG
jgi:hypothetical protein